MMFKTFVVSCAAVAMFTIRPALAGCGGCSADGAAATPAAAVPTANVLNEVGDTGSLEGMVLASCGMCNFGADGKPGCSLAIKVGEKVFPVEGTTMKEHGNSHAADGMCRTVRVADVAGTVEDEVFKAKAFELQKKK